jgi:hypothetical protein
LCDQLWLTSDAQRSRRAAVEFDASMDKHLGWLSDEQKAELKAMKAEGADHEALKKKVWDYFNNLSGSQKDLATEKLKSSCSAWLKEAASEDEIAELKRLHETSHGECKKKVLTYLERLPEDRKNQVKKYLDICEKVWYGTSDSHQHHRRSIQRRSTEVCFLN